MTATPHLHTTGAPPITPDPHRPPLRTPPPAVSPKLMAGGVLMLLVGLIFADWALAPIFPALSLGMSGPDWNVVQWTWGAAPRLLQHIAWGLAALTALFLGYVMVRTGYGRPLRLMLRRWAPDAAGQRQHSGLPFASPREQDPEVLP